MNNYCDNLIDIVSKKIKEEQNRVDNIEVVELPNYNNQYEKKNINKNFEKFW